MSDFGNRRIRRERRTFGKSWWGEAWIEAIEKRAHLDSNRLPRGRAYARWGYVGELTVRPGSVAALVEGSTSAPYRTYVRVPAFSDDEWSALIDVVAGKVAHAAVLADGELSPQLIDDAAAVGIELLPTDGEITTGCSCPDDANPCKHAAAVCYLIADLLDDDPFALLHLRGRTQEEVAKALRSRRNTTTAAPPERGAEEGVDPLDAYINYTGEAPPPLVPRPPARAGTPVALPPHMPHDTEVAYTDLVSLATDAAHRAWELCNGMGDGGLRLHRYSDLIRRAVPMLDTPALARFARQVRMPLRQLEEDARLWKVGGETALEDAVNPWYPDQDELRAGIETLERQGKVSVRENRVVCTDAGVQLRLGESGRWYRYEKVSNTWRFTRVENEDESAL